MTGYGEAHYESESLSLSIELRALNNRHLKVPVRAPEPYNLLEPDFEKVVRRTIRRGTIQLNLHCERQHTPQDFRVNGTALRSYLEQLRAIQPQLGLGPMGGETLLAQVLALPGVVPEPGNTTFNAEAEWPIFERVLEEALARLQTMRKEEGQAMAQEFLQYRDQIAAELGKIR